MSNFYEELNPIYDDLGKKIKDKSCRNCGNEMTFPGYIHSMPTMEHPEYHNLNVVNRVGYAPMTCDDCGLTDFYKFGDLRA